MQPPLRRLGAGGGVTVGLEMRGGSVPPIRQSPAEADPRFDGARIAYAWKRWDSQTQALRLRDRQVEENVRMLCGQQNIVWNTVLQRYVDVSHWMTDEERRWRQRPVINKLAQWYSTTHARLTENPPIITFLAGPDSVDSQLAEVMDTIFKSLWREIGMGEVMDRLMSWLIVGGRGLLHTRVDLTEGAMRQWVGPATLPMMNPMNGSPIYGPDGAPIMQTVDGVPFGSDGQALAVLTPNGLMPKPGSEGMTPHFDREGQLVVDVLSPLEARAQWGGMPWHRKKWQSVKSFLTPEEVYDKWGVHVEPDVDGISADSAGELERLLFGGGYFGAASGKVGTDLGAPQSTSDKYCEVLTYYEAPSRCEYEPRLEETPESPGGRMIITTRKKMLIDAVRPMAWKYTGPIRCFDFMRIPGRPSGSTPQETLNAPQRAFNRAAGSVIEHTRLMTNPITLVDTRAGLASTSITNAPGQKFTVNKIAGVSAIEYVAPPSLGQDVYKILSLLSEWIDELGSLEGTEGSAPGRDASGELVKELRFNTDRYVGPTMRRAAEECGRLAEDWREFIKLLWDRNKVISYAGEDTVARTIVVYPYLLRSGSVDVVPDVESMLPEGRGERQAKVYRMWADGMFGMPQSPQAIGRYLELSQMPNLSKAARPGGSERATAEQILARLVQGDPSVLQVWWPWYSPPVHLDCLVAFASSPEFLKQPTQIQQLILARYQFVMGLFTQQMMPPPPMPGPQLPPAPTIGGPGPLEPPPPSRPTGGPTTPQVTTPPYQQPTSQMYGRSPFPLPAGPPPQGGGPGNTQPGTGQTAGPPGQVGIPRPQMGPPVGGSPPPMSQPVGLSPANLRLPRGMAAGPTEFPSTREMMR